MSKRKKRPRNVPFFRQFDGWWYAQVRVGGKAAATYEWYYRFLQSFSRFVGGELTVADLTPEHVYRWTYLHPKWRPMTKRGAILTVQRAFRWVERHKKLPSPLHGMEKPEAESRELFLTPEQFKAIISRVRDPHFLDLVTFLWETGARPQEAFAADASHFDGSRLVFPRQQAKGKKKARVVYLGDNALAMVQRRIATQGEGPILRHCRGGRWNKDNVNVRFRRIRKKVNITGLCAYTLRHSFATQALLRGVDPVTLSHLMGHSDLKMITKVYAHIAHNGDHLRAALRKITGVCVGAAAVA